MSIRQSEGRPSAYLQTQGSISSHSDGINTTSPTEPLWKPYYKSIPDF